MLLLTRSVCKEVLLPGPCPCHAIVLEWQPCPWCGRYVTTLHVESWVCAPLTQATDVVAAAGRIPRLEELCRYHTLLDFNTVARFHDAFAG
jgi:hypothetical protein